MPLKILIWECRRVWSLYSVFLAVLICKVIRLFKKRLVFLTFQTFFLLRELRLWAKWIRIFWIGIVFAEIFRGRWWHLKHVILIVMNSKGLNVRLIRVSMLSKRNWSLDFFKRCSILIWVFLLHILFYFFSPLLLLFILNNQILFKPLYAIIINVDSDLLCCFFYSTWRKV